MCFWKGRWDFFINKSIFLLVLYFPRQNNQTCFETQISLKENPPQKIARVIFMSIHYDLLFSFPFQQLRRVGNWSRSPPAERGGVCAPSSELCPRRDIVPLGSSHCFTPRIFFPQVKFMPIALWGAWQALGSGYSGCVAAGVGGCKGVFYLWHWFAGQVTCALTFPRLYAALLKILFSLVRQLFQPSFNEQQV